MKGSKAPADPAREANRKAWELLAKTHDKTARHVAIDPRSGLHLRKATAAERRAYIDQPNHYPFRKPVRVGLVLIDEYTGPGISHAGAGF